MMIDFSHPLNYMFHGLLLCDSLLQNNDFLVVNTHPRNCFDITNFFKPYKI